MQQSLKKKFWHYILKQIRRKHRLSQHIQSVKKGKKKKKRNTPIYFNTNYHTEMNWFHHHGLLST